MPRLRVVRTFSVAAAALAFLAATEAQAQGITFTPYVGSFYAAASFVDQDVGGETLTVDQSNTVIFGARLSVPLTSTIGLEGAFGYAQSDVILRITNSCQSASATVFDCSTNFKGNVLMGSGRLLFRPRRSNIHFLGGVTYVKHSGDAWDDPSTTETGDLGGVVGLGIRANITPRFVLSLNAEGHFYSFDPDGDDSVFEKKTQTDLLFTVGLPISLSR